MHMLYVDEDNCRGCGSCTFAAPDGSIIMDGAVAKIVNKKCSDEAKCIEACPFGFIKKKDD